MVYGGESEASATESKRILHMGNTLKAQTKCAHCVRGRPKKMYSAFGTFRSTNFTSDRFMIEHLEANLSSRLTHATSKLPMSEPIDNISKLSSNTVILIKITIHDWGAITNLRSGFQDALAEQLLFINNITVHTKKVQFFM